MLTVTKRLAARAEIEGAIRCIAADENYLAGELLASAAIDVIAGVAKVARIETMNDRFLERIKRDKVQEAKNIMRKPYNFLKHSDRDRDTAIDRYNPDAAIWRIFVACIDYDLVWNQITFRMIVFMSWFYSRNPSVLEGGTHHEREAFEKSYGSMASLSRTAALGVLGRILRDLDGTELLILANRELAATGRIER